MRDSGRTTTPYSLSFDAFKGARLHEQSFETSNGIWFDMSERLRPLLGDVRRLLGPRWHEVLDTLYTKHDLDVARALQIGRSRASTWFILSFPTDLPLSEDLGGGEWRLCAESEAEAIAFLRAQCGTLRLLPDAISHDPATHCTSLYLGGLLIASVAPAQFHAVVSTQSRRAKSALLGLRNGPRKPEEELLRRLAGWPKMPSIELQNSARHRLEMTHPPDPKEWLASARKLCELCGESAASTNLVQKVAAAALAVPSWNHLPARSGDRLTNLTPPWILSLDADSEPRIYRSAYDALADCLLRLPTLLASESSGLELDYSSSFGGQNATPVIHFCNRRDFGGSILIHEVPGIQDRFDDLPSRTETAHLALVDGSTALARYFNVHQSPEQRAKTLDADNAESLITQEGAWRFTISRGESPTGDRLTAHRIGTNGSSEFVASVACYKGQLRLLEGTRFHVLCGDYDGRSPVAVVEGLSANTVKLLHACLSENEVPSFYDTFAVDYAQPFANRDAERFAELLAQARKWRESASYAGRHPEVGGQTADAPMRSP